MQGYLHATHDLVWVIDLAPDNCAKAITAMTSIGLRPRLPVSIDDLSDPLKRKQWAEESSMLVFQLLDPNYSMMNGQLRMEL